MEGKRVLEGWKAISAYLGRTGKTCRKWEHELGLPVHRLDGSVSAHVFAYADELDRWKEGKLLAEESRVAKGLPLRSQKTRFGIIAASAAVLLVTGAAALLLWKIIPLMKAPAAPKIENSIAVISFKNLTGDSSYDYLQDAIPSLVITNLENTGLFYVATWERMKDVLKQMGVRLAGAIDSDLGFEVCRREGIKAMAIGSFTKAGDVFRTDVKVLDAETKRLLNSANVKGTGVESILDTQVDALSREMSLGLGIEKTKVEAAPLNIKDITTQSLNAYEYFLKGKEAYALMSWAELRKNMEKALKIDPTFAMASVYLAYADHFLGDLKARNDGLEKAMALYDRMPEKDRLYLESAYAIFIKEDREKGQMFLEKIIQKYPREKWAFHNLGDLLYINRDYIGACNQFRKWLELDPQDKFAVDHLLMATIPRRDFKKAREYIRMREAAGPPDPAGLTWQAEMYRKMGQLDEAIAKEKEALKIKPDYIISLNNLHRLYALKEEYEEALRWVNDLLPRAFSAAQKSFSFRMRGFYRYWRGNFKDALADFVQSEKMADEAEYGPWKVAALEWKGIAHMALNEPELSRTCFDSAVSAAERFLPKEAPAHKARAALWMGHLALRQGRLDQANAWLSELESLLSKLDKRTQNELHFWRDLLQGEVFLAQGALDAALSVSQKACQQGSPFLDESAYFMDLLSRVYAQRGETGKAISEYERLFMADTSAKIAASEYERPVRPYGEGDVINLIHPLYHYRLGILCEKAGETAKATAQYEKFLHLWKDADPGQPEIEDARKRLTGLK